MASKKNYYYDPLMHPVIDHLRRKALKDKAIKYFVLTKFYIIRGMLYYQIIYGFMIFMIFANSYSMNLWMKIIFAVLCFVGIVIVGRMDRRMKILEKEQSLYNSESNEIRQILEIIKRIEGRINEKTN
jgi:hypothetical protein